MIRFIEHNDLNTEKWDECIKNSVNSMPYAFSWYLDIVVEHWNALVLNDYEAVFPLPTRKKFGITYAFTPFWVQQLGLFSKTYKGLRKIDDFVAAIPSKYKYVELNMNHDAEVNEGLEVHLKQNNNFLIKLNKSYEQQYELYSKNLKRNLKKNTTHGLEMFKNDAPKNLIQLFRSDKGKYMKHFSEKDYKILEQIMHVSIYKHCGQVYMAYDEGNRPVAGMFLLIGLNRVVMLFSGNSDEGRKKAALPFLINEFIKEFAGSSFIYDFEGSNDANLKRFYESFGSVNHPYQTLKINRLPFLMRYFK